MLDSLGNARRLCSAALPVARFDLAVNLELPLRIGRPRTFTIRSLKLVVHIIFFGREPRSGFKMGDRIRSLSLVEQYLAELILRLCMVWMHGNHITQDFLGFSGA